jgi:CRISPR system Cascade subunit CasC
MKNGDMIQVHLLTAYPASLLNRDDAGFAKRMPFGGAWRTRVSSQCLKKHWRDAAGIRQLGPQATRSRLIYEREIARPLSEESRSREGRICATDDEARQVARYLLDVTLSKSDKKEGGSGKEDPAAEIATSQVVVLTHAEIAFLQEVAERILEEIRLKAEDGGNVEQVMHEGFYGYLEESGILDSLKIKDGPEVMTQAKKRISFLRTIRDKYFVHLAEKDVGASFDTAMFGRMVTSDLFARVDAAVAVAHAFTTHAEHKDVDYFTAVDSLKEDSDDSGAGLIQETELATGIFYSYGVVDVAELRRNLGAQADKARELIAALIRAMATVSPGAKQGSTAPFSHAEFVLLERGPQQPRTLANAFLQPVRANGRSLMAESVASLIAYRAALEEMYERFDSDGTEALSTIHGGVLPADVRKSLQPAPLREAIRRIVEEV